MKHKIVFDLDGVLRDINFGLFKKYLIPYPKEWFWTYKGRDIFDWMEFDEFDIIQNCNPTEYLKIVKKHFNGDVEIWTSQPEEWIPFTKEWIHKNIGKTCKVLFLSNEEKRDKLDKNNDILLVDDSPCFKNFINVITIDRPYNRLIEVNKRLCSPQELDNFIKKNK